MEELIVNTDMDDENGICDNTYEKEENAEDIEPERDSDNDDESEDDE